MYIPEDDGVTHINVYSKGMTWLGRRLSNFARTPFQHPDHGNFLSVEGYWYWLGCRDDRLRAAVGFTAKRLGRECGAPDWMDDEEFKDNIRTALTCKVLQNPQIRDALYDNTLPLAHYYVYGGKVVPAPKGQWILDHLESIFGEREEK